MRAEIPKLADYDVSPVSGFLPEELPLQRLPDNYYEPWERIAQELPGFVMTRQVRNYIDSMPKLSLSRLTSEPEWRRACSILGFLMHAYVWSGDLPSDHIPSQLSDPFIEACDHFGLPAVNTYANMCLWNHKTLFPTSNPEEWTLENLTTLTTFTGCIDESWFFLVSTAIEREGAKSMSLGLEALHAARANDGNQVTRNLQEIAQEIDSLRTSLARMFEMCDPHTFYFRVRPYLAGWKNMADAGLPNGVRYGDESEYRQYAGGSNAQSSLIQALDILLSVEHHPTGQNPGAGSKTTGVRTPKANSFIHDMRKYMPRKHRMFLEHLEQVSELREFVVENGDKFDGLTLAYDACLAMLRSFRDKHIQVVSRYIIIQAKESQRQAAEATRRQGLAAAKQGKTGTGGSALIPFLKQARDETGDAAAGSWGQRLLSNTRKPVAYSYAGVKQRRDQPSAEENRTSVGIAGSFDLSQDGISHW